MSGRTDAGDVSRRPRRGYLDWLRGLAVLVMIEAHLLDSWTGLPDRESRHFVRAMILGGFGAPLFLFLAGLSVALSAGSKFRRTQDASAASSAVVRRGLEIFGLAFLFRLQAVIVSWGAWRSLLRIDILNIMGPSIMGTAALWGAVRTTGGRYVAFAVTAIAISLVTPIVRELAWLGALPDYIEGYIRPVQPYSTFVLFPWAGLVFAGAVLGLAIDGARTRAAETRANWWFFAGGAAIALAAFGGSYLPSPYQRSDFWTSSPSYFFLRVGVLTVIVALAYAWESRPGGQVRWSPLQQLGRTSLFIYWIHVELIYGLISLPIHKSMTLWQAGLAFVAFSLLMLLASLGKDRAVAAWQTRGGQAP